MAKSQTLKTKISYNRVLNNKGVHRYTDDGGKLKNKWKGVFEEALVK